MNREIEYRAWHKEDKKMLHVCGIDWMINLEDDCVDIGVVRCAERRSDGWVNGGSHDIDNVILMQYTGIKDKNGVKIFEGDVINVSVFSVGASEVKYVNSAFRLYPHANTIGGFFSKELEVIGNIHEDKELSS